MTALHAAVVPSALLAAGIVATHAVAAALLWLVPLAAPVQAALTLAVAASLVDLLARHALLRLPRSIVELEIRDGALSLKMRSGEWLEGEVLGSSYVSPRVTLVNFRPRGRWRVRHVVLVPDNVDAGDFRRLRTWLRWKSGEEAASGAAKEA